MPDETVPVLLPVRLHGRGGSRDDGGVCANIGGEHHPFCDGGKNCANNRPVEVRKVSKSLCEAWRSVLAKGLAGVASGVPVQTAPGWSEMIVMGKSSSSNCSWSFLAARMAASLLFAAGVSDTRGREREEERSGRTISQQGLKGMYPEFLVHFLDTAEVDIPALEHGHRNCRDLRIIQLKSILNHHAFEGAYPDDANVRIRLFSGLPEEWEESLSVYDGREAARIVMSGMKREEHDVLRLTSLPSSREFLKINGKQLVLRVEARVGGRRNTGAHHRRSGRNLHSCWTTPESALRLSVSIHL